MLSPKAAANTAEVLRILEQCNRHLDILLERVEHLRAEAPTPRKRATKKAAKK